MTAYLTTDDLTLALETARNIDSLGRDIINVKEGCKMSLNLREHDGQRDHDIEVSKAIAIEVLDKKRELLINDLKLLGIGFIEGDWDS